MKRMLINATQEEELRMAMVDGQSLFDLNIEGPSSERKKANIYKGKITRIEPSLEAAFVEYGADRHGFLPLKEISSEYFVKDVESGGKPNIKEVLKEGQDIVVQIDKEERGNKGAALTTFVSLAGRFIVLKPNKARSGGVSRRIVGEDRDAARQSLNDVEIPKGMSVILRTAGIDRSAEELTWDIETLMQVWQAILDHVLIKPAPFLLYRESNAVARALRDYLSNDVGEILIDDEETYKEAVEQVTNVMPHNLKKLKYYDDPVPLFTRFQIETQIESAFSHMVTLPSGGSIVIDHTEALVSIDINSARATKGSDIEATALHTNLEAADEIARQLRIRDLGGLIVIDFIDMGPQRNQRDVENRLRDAVRQDRARVQIGQITRFGLLEMSRQRLRPSISESAHQTCPRCSGIGTIRSVESLALAILRIIGEEARKERTAKVIAQLPIEVATYLLNEKRDWVQSLELSHETQVILVANSALETPHYDVRRVRDDQTEIAENSGVSYALAEAGPEPEAPQSIEDRKAAEQAAIGVIEPATPAPKRQKTGGFWAWLTGLFAGDGKPKKKTRQQSRGRRSGAAQSKRGRGSQPRSRGRNEQRQQGGGNRQRSRKKPAQKKQDANKGRDQQAKSKSKAKAKDTQKQAQPQDGPQKDAPKQDAPKQDAPKQDAPKQDQARDESKRPSRNRRSRGGRRRRRTAEDNPAQDRPAQDRPAQDRPTPDTATMTEQQLQQQEFEAKKTAVSEPPRVRTDAESAAEVTPKVEARPEPKVEAKPEPKVEPKPDPKAEVKADPKAEVKAEPKAEVKAEPKPKIEPKPEPNPEVKAEPKPKTEPKSEPKAESKAESKPKAEPKPAKESQGNGSPEKVAKKPAAQAVEKPAAKPTPKPAGRLLPWDPPSDSAE